jgi:hypothetical protein
VGGVFFGFGACVGGVFVVKYRALETPPCVDRPEGLDNTLNTTNRGRFEYFLLPHPLKRPEITLEQGLE